MFGFFRFARMSRWAWYKRRGPENWGPAVLGPVPWANLKLVDLGFVGGREAWKSRAWIASVAVLLAFWQLDIFGDLVQVVPNWLGLVA